MLTVDPSSRRGMRPSVTPMSTMRDPKWFPKRESCVLPFKKHNIPQSQPGRLTEDPHVQCRRRTPQRGRTLRHLSNAHTYRLREFH
jgi:hypothetical protein